MTRYHGPKAPKENASPTRTRKEPRKRGVRLRTDFTPTGEKTPVSRLALMAEATRCSRMSRPKRGGGSNTTTHTHTHTRAAPRNGVEGKPLRKLRCRRRLDVSPKRVLGLHRLRGQADADLIGALKPAPAVSLEAYTEESKGKEARLNTRMSFFPSFHPTHDAPHSGPKAPPCTAEATEDSASHCRSSLHKPLPWNQGETHPRRNCTERKSHAQ